MNDHESTGGGPETATVIRRGDAGRLFRLLIAAIVVAAVVIVGFDNRQDVRVGYAIGETTAPIWIVLLAAGVAGIIVGWLIKHRPHHQR